VERKTAILREARKSLAKLRQLTPNAVSFGKAAA